jgi:acyl carrier protein
MDTLTSLVTAVLRLPPGDPPPGLSRTTHGDAWTSMRHVELMVSIEEQYGIPLTAAEMTAVDTIDDLRRLVTAKHAQR